MFQKLFITSSIAIALAAPSLASAQVTGNYAGIGVGKTRFKEGCPAASAAGCDKSDMGLKFFTGVEFGSMWGAEFGLTDLGEARNGNSSFSVTGGELTGLARWPLSSNFSVFGKLGGYYSAVSASTPNAFHKSTDWTYGLGVKMDFARNVGARLEWQRYNDVGDSSTGQSDVDYLGVSLVGKF